MKNMIYVETGSTDVCFNLASEYYFATEKRLDAPVYLLWRTTPTLVVGKFQNALEEIDRNYAEEKGITVVRRLSGGGTMYLDEGGLQFTFIEPSDGIGIQFKQYILPIVQALQKLGIPAGFNGRNDLVVQGKKFSGNSQYKLNGITVHHGTMMFATNVEEMVKATTVDPDKIISKSIKSVRERVTNLREHLPVGTDLSYEAFKHHMITAVAGDPVNEYRMTDADVLRIEQIAEEKFRGYDNVYGRSPKFGVKNAARFAGGKVCVFVQVENGKIKECAFTGDFFSPYESEELSRPLIGCRYHPDDIALAVESLPEDAIYCVTKEELTSLVSG